MKRKKLERPGSKRKRRWAEVGGEGLMAALNHLTTSRSGFINAASGHGSLHNCPPPPPPPTIHPPPHPSARRTPPHAASHGSTCGRELLFASVSGQFAERGAAPSSTICWRDTGVIKLGGVKWLLWVWKLASFLQNKVKMGWQRCFIFSQTVQAHATGLGMIPDRLHSSLQSIDKTPGLSLHTLLTSPTPPDSAANNTQDTNSHSKTNRTGNTDLLWRHN